MVSQVCNATSAAPNHHLTPLTNYVRIFLALYFPLCGYAYLADLLIGSVSMFDFAFVVIRKKEVLGTFGPFLCTLKELAD